MMTEGSMLARKAVGPTTKKNTARPSAKTRLMLDSQRMPLDTPETAEKIVPMESTMMMARPSIMRAGVESVSRLPKAA